MKKNIALLGIIFGGFFFSLELYLLKILQLLEKTTGSWFENILEYAKSFPVNLSFLLTGFIILFCFGLFFFGKNKS